MPEKIFPIAVDPTLLKTGIPPEKAAARPDERSFIRGGSAESFVSACSHVDRKQFDMA
jgi:hypothetical protein